MTVHLEKKKQKKSEIKHESLPSFQGQKDKRLVQFTQEVLFYNRFHFLCETEARALIGPLGA